VPVLLATFRAACCPCRQRRERVRIGSAARLTELLDTALVHRDDVRTTGVRLFVAEQLAHMLDIEPAQPGPQRRYGQLVVARDRQFGGFSGLRGRRLGRGRLGGGRVGGGLRGRGVGGGLRGRGVGGGLRGRGFRRGGGRRWLGHGDLGHRRSVLFVAALFVLEPAADLVGDEKGLANPGENGSQSLRRRLLHALGNVGDAH